MEALRTTAVPPLATGVPRLLAAALATSVATLPALAGETFDDAFLVTDDVREEVYPAWTPDGLQIVFRADWPDLDPDSEIPANHNLWLVPASGGTRLDCTQLTDDGEYDDMPHVDPSGERVVFISGRENGLASDIYVVPIAGEPAGATATALTSDAGLIDCGPRFSPDGERIAFYSNRSGTFQIWVMEEDGTGLEQLTFTSTGAARPSWSPDGEHIAYVSQDAGNLDVWTVPVAGGDPVQITDTITTDTTPSWSPTGSHIAYASSQEGNQDVYLIPVAGGDPTRITFDPAIDGWPAFSPSGEQIAFRSERVVQGRAAAGPGEKSIWVIEVGVTPVRSISWTALKELLGG